MKKIAVIAMFSDDYLMELFALKGGNALDLVLGISGRSSKDIDLSMKGDFKESEFASVSDRLENAIRSTYELHGYTAFDVVFRRRPNHVMPKEEFWGGYQLEFKTIEKDQYEAYREDREGLRRQAIPVTASLSPKIYIDISKGEFCEQRQPHELDGYVVYVYSPEMIVAEKLRAICQQMREYGEYVVNPSQSARARDFYDIHKVVSTLGLDMSSPTNLELLGLVFSAKHVPIEFLRSVHESREYHRPDFISVQETVREPDKLKEFDFYFDFVVFLCDSILKSLG